MCIWISKTWTKQFWETIDIHHKLWWYSATKSLLSNPSKIWPWWRRGFRHKPAARERSSPVSIALETEPELEDAVVELTSEAVTMRQLPFAVDNLESDVLVKQKRKTLQRMKPHSGEWPIASKSTQSFTLTFYDTYASYYSPVSQPKHYHQKFSLLTAISVVLSTFLNLCNVTAASEPC